MKLLLRPISASDLIPDKLWVISMEFMSLSRRRSSSWNVLHWRWARRNVCRSQASVRGTKTQPLICVSCSVHYWVSCAINKAILWGHCLRLVSLWRANSCRDSYVLGVHLSNICWGLQFVFVKRTYFKSLRKVSYLSVFVESSKAYNTLSKIFILD